MPGAAQHTPRFGNQWKDMSRLDNVLWAGIGCYRRAHRVGPLYGADARSQFVGSVDGDSEIGSC